MNAFSTKYPAIIFLREMPEIAIHIKSRTARALDSSYGVGSLQSIVHGLLLFIVQTVTGHSVKHRPHGRVVLTDLHA